MNKYRLYKVHKRHLYANLLDKAVKHLHFHKKLRVFVKWKQYVSIQRNTRLKIEMACRFDRNSHIKRSLKAWFQFLKLRRHEKMNMILACTQADKKILNRCMQAWKTYVKEEVKFKSDIKKAKSYYHQQLLIDGLCVIVKSGLRKKENNFKNHIMDISKKIALCQKYMSLWKQKTIYKNANFQNNIAFDDKENIPTTSDWYPVCFLTPRMPKNFL
nr:unnamed protein product [Callosobruchus analis]